VSHSSNKNCTNKPNGELRKPNVNKNSFRSGGAPFAGWGLIELSLGSALDFKLRAAVRAKI
jgi:hypothetical protein